MKDQFGYVLLKANDHPDGFDLKVKVHSGKIWLFTECGYDFGFSEEEITALYHFSMGVNA